jgi:hypothetical protein
VIDATNKVPTPAEAITEELNWELDFWQRKLSVYDGSQYPHLDPMHLWVLGKVEGLKCALEIVERCR